MGFEALLFFLSLHVSSCVFLRSDKTISTATSSKQGWGEAGQKLGNYQQQQKCLHQHIGVVLRICVRLHDLKFSLTNTRVARQVLFEIRPALFDLQEQGVIRNSQQQPQTCSRSSSKNIKASFQSSHGQPTSQMEYFWLLLFAGKNQTSISWGHYHMSGKPVKQSIPAVCFSCFTEGKLKGL